jgi:hypothetical protein
MQGTIASNVSLGQQFTLTLKAGHGDVRIYYNGALKAATAQGKFVSRR